MIGRLCCKASDSAPSNARYGRARWFSVHLSLRSLHIWDHRQSKYCEDNFSTRVERTFIVRTIIGVFGAREARNIPIKNNHPPIPLLEDVACPNSKLEGRANEFFCVCRCMSRSAGASGRVLDLFSRATLDPRREGWIAR